MNENREIQSQKSEAEIEREALAWLEEKERKLKAQKSNWKPRCRRDRAGR